MKNMHVLLLCGGGGAEHEVSLRSANFLEQQLGLLPGVEVTRVEMFADRWLSADGRECKLGLDKLLSFDSVARPVDYVVPCIHGYPGETGDLQSFLELAGLPYLGCDAEASKICFNKISTKLWLSAIGIPNTPYLFLTEQGDAALAEDFLMNVADPLRYPKIDLTEAQVAEIRKLKARMEAERLPRGVRRDRHLKLGKGGLSDVEWTIQLLQLQHAGDNANLRVNGTMQALDELERRKLVSAGDAVVLRRAWWMCTAARNGSYLWSGRVNQADILPDDSYSLGGVAVYLGYDANRGQHFENDLLAEINYENVPNLKYIDDIYMEMSKQYDPENKYSVPYLWGTVGILYNKKMVDEPVDSWNILWDEKYTDSILMQDSVRDAFAVALKSLGYSLNSTDLDELEAAKKLLIKQKPLVQAYVIDQY